MAYSAPSTISTGDLITASIWNQDVVANPIAIYAGAMSVTSQAVGDILYASSTTQFARIAAVATGQVLTSAGTGTVPAYSATPALTSVDMGGTTVYGSRAITVDTGGVLNIVLASSAGDDFTVDTDKLVVSGDTGYIGVGTAAPTKILHVIGDIKLQSSQVHLTDGYGLLWGDNGINGNASTDSLRLDTAGGARLTIDSAGLVNMGNNLTVNGDAAIGMATIGDGTLHVHTATAGSVTAGGGADDLVVENSTHAGMTFLSPSGDYQQTIAFGDVGDPDSGRIVYDHNSNMLALWTEGSERVTIDSSGDVGIGTVTPNYMSAAKALTLQGSTQPRIEIVGTRTGDDATGEITFINRVSTTNNVMGVIKSNRVGADNSGSLTFHTYNAGSVVLAMTLSPAGALSKASGSFKIDHPLPALNETHHLVHSFVEGPRADLIYRGSATLVSGTATVDLDAAAGMTAGTWVLLCRDEQVYTSNETGWKHVRGSVSGSTLTIDCEDTDCTDTISWMVVAERQDQHMLDTDWTDNEGRVIVEPEKAAAPDPE